jgi:predicted ATP-grasp superfamily ATP-dependent carboligase
LSTIRIAPGDGPVAHGHGLDDAALAWSVYQTAISFLLDLRKRIGIRPVLVVKSDQNALLVAENAEALAGEYILATPSAEVIRAFFNKKNMFDLCCNFGVPAPHTALPLSLDEALLFAHKVKYPVIVKGEYDRFLIKAGQKARVAILSSERELIDIFNFNAVQGPPGFIVQEYIPGKDDTIWMTGTSVTAPTACSRPPAANCANIRCTAAPPASASALRTMPSRCRPCGS